MKPFNLEAALAGEKVITRDGQEVTQLTKFDVKGEFVIYGVVNKTMESWTTKGSWNREGTVCNTDLFMAPKKLSGFVNVYPSGTGQIHLTKSRANGIANGIANTDREKRLACIDLSQFEEGHGLEK